MKLLSSSQLQRGAILSLSLVLSLLSIVPVRAAFSVPPNDGFVTDAAGILSIDQRQTLSEFLTAYRDATTNEIAVVILQSLEGEPIENAGLAIARAWGVGSQSKNNGLLLLVSYDDRQVRFDTGHGLEGALPDIVLGGIIDTDLVPHFRDGNYFDGIRQALDSVIKHIGGEYTAERYDVKGTEPSSAVSFLFVVGFVLFQWLLSVLGRTKSWWLGGVFGAIGGVVLVLLFQWWLSIPALIVLGLLLDYVVSKNFHKRGPTHWWAGGSWGPGGSRFGGASGGFRGFGGGGFGGGGASGRW